MHADASYVLPLRWRSDDGLQELTGYIEYLAHHLEVVVVDGSPPELFERHAATWRPRVRHLPPDAELAFRNGKVNGATTGVRAARGERVVIADDDVRYELPELERVISLLDGADLVRPQNFFDPLPWHARWDSARSLLNRCVGQDFPGTLGVRRSTFLAIGGYDGDVLFENLELIRTFEASGGRVRSASDLFVRRLPPTTAHFLSQRVRQAYDELANPLRLASFLSIVPAVGLLGARKRVATIALTAVASVALAEIGRRRAHGRRVFPAPVSLFAPLWLLERGVCIWIALAARALRGGVRYGDSRIRVAAHSRAQLRRRLGQRSSSGALPARKRVAV